MVVSGSEKSGNNDGGDWDKECEFAAQGFYKLGTPLQQAAGGYYTLMNCSLVGTFGLVELIMP